jgi:23S rRNA pseudouridine1911/1915/1917 synthase
LSDRLLVFDFTLPDAQRLDKFLVGCLPEFSRARLQGLIADGLVLVDGEPARKSGQMLTSGAQVQVRIPPAALTDLVPEAIPLDILFENDDLMVVNKPAGMVVHPAAGHASGTLVHAALAHAPEMAGIGGEKRPGVVHRLDKDTSGIILLAKNDAAHHWLQDQFRLRKTKKVYLALVDGVPPTPEGRIEAPIGRNTTHRKLMGVTEASKGREAISEYFTCHTFREHTLLEVHPLTGRTHQIRVHMAFIGCPIAADCVYGHHRPSLPLKRHFLHAWKLTIRLPGEGKPRTFEAPLAPELEQVLETLEQLE